jgi:cytochrome c oxidase subunit IV
MSPKPPTRKLFAIIWLVLVVAHFVILGSAYLNLGFVNTPLMLALAVIQMILIILFFMEVRYRPRMIWLFVAAGFFWLLILFTLVGSDYLTRAWH